jgi:hypothetical protein
MEYYEDFCLCKTFHRTEADILNSSADFIYAMKRILNEEAGRNNKKMQEEKEKRRKEEALGRLKKKYGRR